MAAVQLYNMSLSRTVPCNINIGHSKWLLYNMPLPWTVLYFHVELNKQYSPLLPGLCPVLFSPGTTDYCSTNCYYLPCTLITRQYRWLLYSTIWYYRNSYSEVSFPCTTDGCCTISYYLELLPCTLNTVLNRWLLYILLLPGTPTLYSHHWS